MNFIACNHDFGLFSVALELIFAKSVFVILWETLSAIRSPISSSSSSFLDEKTVKLFVKETSRWMSYIESANSDFKLDRKTDSV